MTKRKHCHMRIMRDVDADVVSPPSLPVTETKTSSPITLPLSLAFKATFTSFDSYPSSGSSSDTTSPTSQEIAPVSPNREQKRESPIITMKSLQQTCVEAEVIPTLSSSSPILGSLSPISHTSRSPSRSPSTSSSQSPLSTPSPSSKKRRLRRLAFSVVVDPSDNPDMNIMRHLSLSVVNVSPKLKAHKLNTFLAAHPLFTSLTPDCRRQVYNEMVLEMFPANTCIYRLGDMNDKFYVLDSGNVQITQDETYPEPYIKHEGDTLGDLSLWQPAHKENTATCLMDTRAYSIDGGLFRFLISSANQTRYQQLQKFYHECGWLSSTFLTSNQLERLIDATDILEFTSGDVITPLLQHTHAPDSITRARSQSQPQPNTWTKDIPATSTHVYVIKEGKVVCTTTRHHTPECTYYTSTPSTSTSTSVESSSFHQSIRTDILQDEGVFGLPLVSTSKSSSHQRNDSIDEMISSTPTPKATISGITQAASICSISPKPMSLNETPLSIAVTAPSPSGMILSCTPTYIPTSLSLPSSSTPRSRTSSSIFTFDHSFVIPPSNHGLSSLTAALMSPTSTSTPITAATPPSTSTTSSTTSTTCTSTACTCPITLHATCSSPAAIILALDWSILSTSLLQDIQHAIIHAYHQPQHGTQKKLGFSTGVYHKSRYSPVRPSPKHRIMTR